MDEIDRICRLHQIRYYLAGGTCLGALRHGGFIPWDDDLDIAMPYADFKKFIQVLSYDLDDRFYLKWITTEKNYPQDFAKVCLRNTSFIEEESCENYTQGIFVDIFPMYPSLGYSRRIERKKKFYNLLHYSMYYKSLKSLDWTLHNLPINLISVFLSSKAIFKLMVLVIHPLSEDCAQYYASYASVYPIVKQITPICWYGEGVIRVFEGREYCCAIESDKKMVFEYGNNYMEIPPEEKRKTHYPLFVKFSDGTTMQFSKSSKKVSYDEILR